jgi:hypothetical protein
VDEPWLLISKYENAAGASKNYLLVESIICNRFNRSRSRNRKLILKLIYRFMKREE